MTFAALVWTRKPWRLLRVIALMCRADQHPDGELGCQKLRFASGPGLLMNLAMSRVWGGGVLGGRLIVNPRT